MLKSSTMIVSFINFFSHFSYFLLYFFPGHAIICIEIYDFYFFMVNWIFPHWPFSSFSIWIPSAWCYYYRTFLLIFAWCLFSKSFDFQLLLVLGISLVSGYRYKWRNSRWSSTSYNEWPEPIHTCCDWCSWTCSHRVCVLLILLKVENLLLQLCIPRTNQRAWLKTVGVQPRPIE